METSDHRKSDLSHHSRSSTSHLGEDGHNLGSDSSHNGTSPHTYSNPTSRAWEESVSFVKTVVILLALAIFLRGTVVEAFKIPSGSMIPTLRIGDHILVSKLSYGFRLPFVDKIIYGFNFPKRRDIVVFTRPDDETTLENESKDNIIKRVIGIPGDEIEVQGNHLYVNKVLQDEPYARWERGGDPIGNFGPVIVPPDHVLLLGDNRDHSRDSRFWKDPFLPYERLKGRALFVYWSWDNLGRIGTVIR
ncbi:MAG: signal peptidase I [Bdellovibrionales bacterium]|nr:signal peptidase I [Bdellovibrionales bacterium]